VRHFDGAVAVKACSAAFPHKSDHGLVTLGVRDEAGAARAYQDLQVKLRALGIEAGVIVAPMISSRREFVLGAKVDPLFGPVVMIGDGGRYVEALGDIALTLAPASSDDIREALLSLRVAPLLERQRGEPGLDIDALCSIAVRLGQIISAFKDQIASIDLNPVMVGPKGTGVLIVDALIERHRRPAAGAGVQAGHLTN
jgi:acyl-CoA synthetase (NDP forming)